MISFAHAAAIILVMGAVTFAIRVAPFLLFDRGGKMPGWVRYLGHVLPPAVMSVLLVYCVRSVDLTAGSRGIPELGCIAVAIVLHLWKGNTLLSIGVSTVLYMALVQLVFR